MLLLVGSSLGAQTVSNTIHLHAVIDELDPQVGMGCKKSWERLKELLLRVRPGQERLTIYQYQSHFPSRGDVLNFFREGKFRANDVLWFHYCGHGEVADGYGHVLKTYGDDLLRSELREAMEARQTRGVVITTDACATNGSYNASGPMPPMMREFFPSDMEIWKRVESLMGGLRGTVDITASTIGTPAFVDVDDRAEAPDSRSGGALFSNSLLKLFQTRTQDVDFNRDGKINWYEAFSFMRDQTRIEFARMRNKMVSLGMWNSEAQDQVPQAFSLGN